MVVGLPCSLNSMGTPTDVPSSAQLKFGMDRILSFVATPTHSFPFKGSHREMMLQSPECISPSARCCNVSYLRPHTQYYTPAIYVPQPLRPYTNVVLQSESHSEQSNASTPQHKRKRSWSRAVFSNLQRKGLEKRFQLQKYITKPDRRQLAATLGLTDAQVKVWFQNRRMKWRHAKEGTGDDTTGSRGKSAAVMMNIVTDADSTEPQSHGVESETESDIDVQGVDS